MPRGQTLREILQLAMFAALTVALQVALAPLPNIEMVSLMFILLTLLYGWKVLYVIYLFAALELLIYGFSLWMICYLYIWTLLAAAVRAFRSIRSPLVWAVISGTFGLLFGALCEIPFVFVIGVNAALAAWASGIPFDLLHCAGNFVLGLVLFRPLMRVLERMKGIHAPTG
jgi:energy-coupling factor transport system substrate-specific component